MHDLSAFRSNLDSVAERLASRNFNLDTERFRSLDAERRAAISETEQLKAQRNSASQEIAALRKAGQDTNARQADVRAIGDRITSLDKRVGELESAFREQLAGIPNLPHESVPLGKGPEDNVEVRRVG